ncbi:MULTISPECIES: hypothetical protein [Sphingomonas]|uniref:hypothetical protein n=1 Tax=Sphingomonas TaxID=13687 RepID=UPI00126A3EE6|nr:MULTISPECIES: hypothetical protein [Sphingomonas]
MGLRTIFANDLQIAFAARTSQQFSGTAYEQKVHRVLDSGFALIQANCNEYFNQMGRNQRDTRVLRDLIAPVSAVVTGIIGLGAFAKQNNRTDVLTGFSLVTGAAASSLDIYDQRFLFGAENIGSVRTMTMTALSNHRRAVMDDAPTELVFAINQLQDNEDLCTPPQILTLVRESIKNAAPKTPEQANPISGENRAHDLTGAQSGGDVGRAVAPAAGAGSRSTSTPSPAPEDHHPIAVRPG